MAKTQAPAIGFKPQEEEAATTSAMVTMVEQGGKYTLHIQLPLDFNALRVKEAQKGEEAPNSAYQYFQARLDSPKGMRVLGNVFIPLRLLQDATIAAAKQRWKDAQAKAKADRAKVASKDHAKLG